jgi:hypothetical protein
MKSRKTGFEDYAPELNPEFVQELMNEWDTEANDTRTNPSKRLNSV